MSDHHHPNSHPAHHHHTDGTGTPNGTVLHSAAKDAASEDPETRASG